MPVLEINARNRSFDKSARRSLVSLRAIGAAGLSCILLLAVTVVPANAATSVGDTCKKPGQAISQKGGKGQLVCLRVAGTTTWVFVPSASSKSQASKALREWRTVDPLQNEDLIRHFALTSDAYVDERLTLAQQGRDQLAQQIVVLTSKQANLQAEITNLPSQITQAQTLYQQAESALAAPRREYTSAATTAALLDAEYTSAYNNRLSYIACKTLEMFGFRAPGDCGTSNDAQYFSIKARYEAARARADSLRANYQARYNDYKAKYDRYKTLFDRQATARNELGTTGAELNAADAALIGAEAHLRASHVAKARLIEIRVALSRLDATKAHLEKLANADVGTKWTSQYERSARLFGILQLHQKYVVESFGSFRALTTDLADPVPEQPEVNDNKDDADGDTSSETNEAVPPA